MNTSPLSWLLLSLSLVCGCGENDFPRITSRQSVSFEDERLLQDTARFASDQIDVWFRSNRQAGPFRLCESTTIIVGSKTEVTKSCDPNGTWKDQGFRVAGCGLSPWRIMIWHDHEWCSLIFHEYSHLAFYRYNVDAKTLEERYDIGHTQMDYSTASFEACKGHEVWAAVRTDAIERTK